MLKSPTNFPTEPQFESKIVYAIRERRSGSSGEWNELVWTKLDWREMDWAAKTQIILMPRIAEMKTRNEMHTAVGQ